MEITTFFLGDTQGHIQYFQNVGTPENFDFEFVTAELGSIDVGSKASPFFMDIDADGDFDLFVGNGNGNVWYCRNDGTPEQYNFADPVVNWLGIEVGDHAAPEFCDIDGDGDKDLFLGKENTSSTSTPPGAIHYWENIGTSEVPDFVEITQNYLTFDAGKTNYVNLCDIDADGDLDIFFNPVNYLGWMENAGSASDPYFQVQTFDLIGYHSPFSCDLADINGDNSPDLVTAGGYSGVLTFYANVSQPGQLVFQEMDELNTGYVVNQVTMADMDSDEDEDLLLGGYESYPIGNILVYYENQGDYQRPNFVYITDNYQGLASVGIYAIVPCLSDIDVDGDFDLLFMDPSTSTVWLYENVGTPQQAQFDSVTNNFLGYDFETPIFIDLCDIENDGDMDAFGGRDYGGINFFRNVTGEPGVRPKVVSPYRGPVLTLGPNPANPVTWVTFNLPAPQKATLAVYNLLGRKVATLAQGLQPAGTNTYLWNAAGFSSGVYVIRLEMEKDAQVGKVVVLR